LKFERPARVPRDLWLLPWATHHHPETLAEIHRRFPVDIRTTIDVYAPSPRKRGDPHAVGQYTDEWGCVFTNIHGGIIGEVREPLVREIEDWRCVRPPYEILPTDRANAREHVRRDSDASERFIMAPAVIRPWERYQFLRGSENALMDLAIGDDDARALLGVIHEYFVRELEFWASTTVDAIFIADDWGSQQGLLIQPALWRAWFKPLYRDYCAIARSHGKFVFMHSDGHIEAIIPDLIEIGVQALNAQLFCMDMAALAAAAKGKITFWGEIDRQHILCSADPNVTREAVRTVARHFYDPAGGIIAQFAFELGCTPEAALAVFDEWERLEQHLNAPSPP
jgi:hypothetical protein